MRITIGLLEIQMAPSNMCFGFEMQFEYAFNHGIIDEILGSAFGLVK